jgi:hypothetical protein
VLFRVAPSQDVSLTRCSRAPLRSGNTPRIC